MGAKMKKYLIRQYDTQEYTQEVYAKSKKEAIQKAHDNFNKFQHQGTLKLVYTAEKVER